MLLLSGWLEILLLVYVCNCRAHYKYREEDILLNDDTSIQYIKIHFYGLPNEVIEYVLKHYTRKRDFHAKQFPSVLLSANYARFPLVNIYKIIADVVNATLVSITPQNKAALANTAENVKQPTMYPTAHLHDGSPYHLLLLWNESLPHTNDISILQSYGMHFNFAYCDVPKYKQIKPWNVYTLTSAFSSKIWALIFVSGVAVSILVSPFPWNCWLVLGNCIGILCALFGPDLSLPLSSRKSVLALLWVFACFVLSNFYLGTITSGVISPSVEEHFARISDLESHNFSLLFSGDRILSILKSEMSIGLEEMKAKSSDETAIRKLLEAPIITEATETTSGEILKPLAFTRNTAVMHYWPFILSMLNAIKVDILPRVDKNSIRCYMGEQLVPAGNIFQFFSPPGGKRLGEITLKIYESGIFLYWFNELLGIQHSTRVQARNRVVSPTIVRDMTMEEGKLPEALEIGGKISCVFFAWAVLLGICVICFIVEYVYEVFPIS